MDYIRHSIKSILDNSIISTSNIISKIHNIPLLKNMMYNKKRRGAI